jgi:hypothetical protein
MLEKLKTEATALIEWFEDRGLSEGEAAGVMGIVLSGLLTSDTSQTFIKVLQQNVLRLELSDDAPPH